MLNVLMNADGKQFWCSARQASAIQTLIDAKKGGFARIKGYISESNRDVPEVADVTVLTRISMDKLYARKVEALKAMTFDDVIAYIGNHPSKLQSLTVVNLRQLFEERRKSEIESLETTLVGDRSDARREAHDTFYANIDTGVKVHFKTNKDARGTNIVYENGHPIVESIMLTYIPISKTVIAEGVYKHVNSGPPKLMGNVLSALLPHSVKIQTASLKEDKFEELIIDGDAIVPDDIAGKYT